MRVVINGGGKVGSFLAQTLAGKGHDVAVIEKNKEVLAILQEELPSGLLLVAGDACDLASLQDAQAERADVFAAVTGRDEENLVSCQLARAAFGVRRTVARVNNPKNEAIFHALGIDAISSTTVIAKLVEEEVSVGDIIRLTTLKRGQIAILEVELPVEGCAACGRPISELRIPPDAILVTLMRGDRVFVPSGATVLHPGDQVIAVASAQREAELRAVLLGP